MLITTNHWNTSDIDKETSNLTQFENDYTNSSDISQEFQPVYLSLSLISSEYC